MKNLAFFTLSLMALACGSSAARNPALVEGPLPSRDTEIGRAARGPAHYCGALGFVDMGAATDGPAYYFRRRDGVIVGHCGGYCMADFNHRCRSECPPAGWTCGPIPQSDFEHQG
jgi:hypothetical protein